MNESPMKTKVSVIVTVLNEAKTIENLLKALLNQSYKADEIIVVDGGSVDQTLGFLKRASEKETRLKIFLKKGNRSLGRNYAITKSENEILAITDAGCIPHIDWLEKLVTKYETTQAPVVAGYYDAQVESSLQEAIVPYVLVMPDQVKEDDFLPATRSMLIEKKAWQAVAGFDEELSDNEDYAFAQKLKKQGFSMVMTKEAKVTWLPRTNLKSFAYMIYRFARGDIKAGIVRPKVLLLFARYLILVFLVGLLAINQSWFLLMFLLGMGVVGYSLWAIKKNYRYVPHGWYWLPLLQFMADGAVLSGSLQGITQRLF